jgi:hypothetical protein
MAHIRLCDEYERLLQSLLRALASWRQLREINGAAPTNSPKRIESELTKAEREYEAALWAARKHTQSCAWCLERLRVHVSRPGVPPAESRAS